MCLTFESNCNAYPETVLSITVHLSASMVSSTLLVNLLHYSPGTQGTNIKTTHEIFNIIQVKRTFVTPPPRLPHNITIRGVGLSTYIDVIGILMFS